MSTSQQVSAAEVREALYELQRYLSDEIAPMMVLDSIELLLRCPAELAGREIEGWVGAQNRGAKGHAVSDYVFHAMKKLHIMSEFDLVDADVLDRYLAQLAEVVLTFTPAIERDVLRSNLSRLGQTTTGTASQVEVIHAQTQRDGLPGAPASAAAPVGPGITQDVAAGLRRFALLANRLETGAPHDHAAREALISQALSTAAVGSDSGSELDRQLEHLARLGYDASPAQLFRSLGSSLPGWELGGASGSEPAALPQSHQLDAMHRLITLSDDPQEGARRFNEMVLAAIEQFNEGRLVQATRMFDLAERIIGEKRLSDDVVTAIRGRTHDKLAPERLREFAGKSERHANLRRVLSFFPALRPTALLADLGQEPKRERRRLLLGLLESWAGEATPAVLDAFRAFSTNPDGDPHGYQRRNMVFLLRRLPALPEQEHAEELDLTIRCMDWGTPLLLVKEAIGALGHFTGPTAEQALIAVLQSYEGLLVAGEVEPYGSDEVRILIDRCASALIRMGTEPAIRAVAEHGLKKQAALGRAVGRLEELSGRDLSAMPDLVTELVGAIRAELPLKVLGFVVSRSADRIISLVRALSSTQAPAVRELLEEIVARFPDQEFGAVAKQVLGSFGVTVREERETDSLTGDIELFGLPNLLQSLSDSRVNGLLTLNDREGVAVGTILISEGAILDCQTGHLRGEIAFHQLFEKPVPGNFQFRSKSKDAIAAVEGLTPFEVLPALLEALRRHDEFQLSRALVPDDATYKATEVAPTQPEDETADPVMRGAWKLASSGTSVVRAEAVLPADAYRVRRLYAHWVEQGALAPA